MSALSRRLGRVEAALAEQYSALTAEERFRLIEAAFGRGDDDARERLISTGRRIALTLSDHAPHTLAFDEIALAMFIEVLETAAGYLEKLHLARAADDGGAPADDGPDDGDGADAEESDEAFESEAEAPFDAHADASYAELTPAARTQARLLDCALIDGFFLKLKVGAWTLFCERIGVPPFATWQRLPGFRRVERALGLAETIAFTAEGVARFRRRLEEEEGGGDDRPEETAPAYSVASSAAEIEECYRQAVGWWDGKT
jgi:hypothetical protein